MKKSSSIRNKYDMKDTCRILGVTYTTVLKLRREGKLKFTRIAQKFFISRHDLNNYMNTGNIFDKPEKVILEVIQKAIAESMEENIQRLEVAVKEKIVGELEENIKKNLIKIDKKNEQLEKEVPKKVAENLRYRGTELKKEFEKVKEM